MSDRDQQIRALGKALATMLPQATPVSAVWAAKLYDEHHVRVETPASPGERAPERHVDRREFAWAALRAKDPALADRIESCTPDERAALAAELKGRIPPEVWEVIAKHIEAYGDAAQ
ncbi:hypothetical protein [Mycobacterium malmoense]|uniref:hypothetical protein n=1 Tax=Mycobacterium malmoense TaxID=1780 RepID=UPI0008F8ACAD|nr:hypothetical protein [Mycobacterium malmoense]OIN80863.1 hypothetical protein BMG05_11045 [Mycobacterium malmoense]